MSLLHAFYGFHLFFEIIQPHIILFFFFFNDPATTEISPLPLHDALPILSMRPPIALPPSCISAARAGCSSQRGCPWTIPSGISRRPRPLRAWGANRPPTATPPGSGP